MSNGTVYTASMTRRNSAIAAIAHLVLALIAVTVATLDIVLAIVGVPIAFISAVACGLMIYEYYRLRFTGAVAPAGPARGVAFAYSLLFWLVLAGIEVLAFLIVWLPGWLG